MAEAVIKRRNILKGYGNRELSDKDLEYVSIHVCAALEHRKTKKSPFM